MKMEVKTLSKNNVKYKIKYQQAKARKYILLFSFSNYAVVPLIHLPCTWMDIANAKLPISEEAKLSQYQSV